MSTERVIWPDPGAVDALIEGQAPDPFEAALLGGQVLRAAGSTAARIGPVRAAIRRLLSGSGLAALSSGLDGRTAELRELWSELSGKLEHGEALAPRELFALLLLRDDLESLRRALAAAATAPGADLEPLEPLRLQSLAAVRTLDTGVEPWLDRLRGVAQAEPAPDELLAMVASDGPAWWLDLVDPLWVSTRHRAAERRTPRALAAASSTPEEVLRREEFEPAAELQIYRIAAGQLRATLIGFAVEPGDPAPEIVWLVGDDPVAVRLEPNSDLPGVLECTVPASVVDADTVFIRQGERLWMPRS